MLEVPPRPGRNALIEHVVNSDHDGIVGHVPSIHEGVDTRGYRSGRAAVSGRVGPRGRGADVAEVHVVVLKLEVQSVKNSIFDAAAQPVPRFVGGRTGG